MGTEAVVFKLPKCNFCGEPARYDGQVSFGRWAYMCQKHYDKHGTGLGTGLGQRLVTQEEAKQRG